MLNAHDTASHAHGQHEVSSSLAEAWRAALYLWIAPVIVGKTVLDVDCRTGDGSRSLLESGAAAVWGLQLGRRPGEGDSPEYVGGPVVDAFEDLSPDARFDLVLCFGNLPTGLPARELTQRLSEVIGGGGVLLLACTGARIDQYLADAFEHVEHLLRQSADNQATGCLVLATNGTNVELPSRALLEPLANALPTPSRGTSDLAAAIATVEPRLAELEKRASRLSQEMVLSRELIIVYLTARGLVGSFIRSIAARWSRRRRVTPRRTGYMRRP